MELIFWGVIAWSLLSLLKDILESFGSQVSCHDPSGKRPMTTRQPYSNAKCRKRIPGKLVRSNTTHEFSNQDLDLKEAKYPVSAHRTQSTAFSSSNPSYKKVLEVNEGKYRTFINVYRDGKMYTLGYPKSTSTLHDVWVGCECKEVDRISVDEANALLDNGSSCSSLRLTNFDNYNEMSKAVSHRHNPNIQSHSVTSKLYGNYTGKCLICGKTLRGNTRKTHCTECYYKYIN